jgi:hypothetical protein
MKHKAAYSLDHTQFQTVRSQESSPPKELWWKENYPTRNVYVVGGGN